MLLRYRSGLRHMPFTLFRARQHWQHVSGHIWIVRKKDSREIGHKTAAEISKENMKKIAPVREIMVFGKSKESNKRTINQYK